ncbi:hypothetical protein NDU88_004573 [Pleurodeles waltl]|uniref:Uncharacterized protein n=1 Tax=Pleurodeles waltl TaxID=8319 RepID=A0AAV7NPP8_PLEWA|nr:hypothetical protein NDU88_004573 [Pleurodeles waltl]
MAAPSTSAVGAGFALLRAALADRRPGPPLGRAHAAGTCAAPGVRCCSPAAAPEVVPREEAGEPGQVQSHVRRQGLASVLPCSRGKKGTAEAFSGSPRNAELSSFLGAKERPWRDPVRKTCVEVLGFSRFPGALPPGPQSKQ